MVPTLNQGKIGSNFIDINIGVQIVSLVSDDFFAVLMFSFVKFKFYKTHVDIVV